MYLTKRSTLGTCLSAIALTSAAVGVLSLTSCGGDRDKAAPPPPPAHNDVPDWVSDATMGGKRFAAYGVAERMLAGEAAMRDRAVQHARMELAATISSKIQAVVKDWIREGGTITSQENLQMAMTSFERASRNVIDEDLKGSQQQARWIDEKGGGKYYSLVVVNGDIVKKMAEDLKNAARANKEIKAHFMAAAQAEEAFKKLDEMIDKKMQVAESK